VTYLSSTQGGANWAGATFGLSPNAGATGNYTDPALQKLDDAIANIQGFTPDIGDTIPGGFGSTEFEGVTEFVSGGDLYNILALLATVQAEALGP
jgi:alpha-glucoside transport system substrate-binding protein